MKQSFPSNNGAKHRLEDNDGNETEGDGRRKQVEVNKKEREHIMSLSIKEVVSYNAEGNVDLGATEAKLDEQLSALKTHVLNEVNKFAADQDAISAAVDQTFDARPQAMSMPLIAHETRTRLGALVTPATYQVITDRINDYLRANIGERGAAKFGQARGRNGGTWRWTDVPETTESK